MTLCLILLLPHHPNGKKPAALLVLQLLKAQEVPVSAADTYTQTGTHFWQHHQSHNRKDLVGLLFGSDRDCSTWKSSKTPYRIRVWHRLQAHAVRHSSVASSVPAVKQFVNIVIMNMTTTNQYVEKTYLKSAIPITEQSCIQHTNCSRAVPCDFSAPFQCFFLQIL